MTAEDGAPPGSELAKRQGIDPQELSRLVEKVRELWPPPPPAPPTKDRGLRSVSLVVGMFLSLLGTWFATDRFIQSRPKLEASIRQIELSYDVSGIRESFNYDPGGHFRGLSIPLFLPPEVAARINNSLRLLEEQLNNSAVVAGWVPLRALEANLTSLRELTARALSIVEDESEGSYEVGLTEAGELKVPFGPTLTPSETRRALGLLGIDPDEADVPFDNEVDPTKLIARWRIKRQEYRAFLRRLHGEVDPNRFFVSAMLGVKNVRQNPNVLIERAFVRFEGYPMLASYMAIDSGGSLVSGSGTSEAALRSRSFQDETPTIRDTLKRIFQGSGSPLDDNTSIPSRKGGTWAIVVVEDMHGNRYDASRPVGALQMEEDPSLEAFAAERAKGLLAETD